MAGRGEGEKHDRVENGGVPRGRRCFVPSTKRKRVRTRARSRRVNDAGESRPMPVSAARLASPSRSGKLDRENRKTASRADYVLAGFIYRSPFPAPIARDFRSTRESEADRIGDGSVRRDARDLDNSGVYCISNDLGRSRRSTSRRIFRPAKLVGAPRVCSIFVERSPIPPPSPFKKVIFS